VPTEEEEEITETVAVLKDVEKTVMVPKIVHEKVEDPACHWHKTMHSHPVAKGEEVHEHFPDHTDDKK